jgi:hypothetical protein
MMVRLWRSVPQVGSELVVHAHAGFGARIDDGREPEEGDEML